MNELTQLKKLMEAVVYNESQFDDEPFIQAHNLPGDRIIDNYRNGNISYEKAEAQLIQFYDDPGDLEMAMGELNTAYGDSDEVEWDEESGGCVVREAGWTPGNKVSKLEHAKRLGDMGMKDALRVIDVLLVDLGLENNADAASMLIKLQTDLNEYKKIINTI